MGLFTTKPITSYTTITFRISGMRLSSEYEIVSKDGTSEISEYYYYCAQGGGMERRLERSASCPDEEMLKLLNDCEAMKWNGFHGKHPHGVKDGEMFSFKATVNGGEVIEADGSANFPKHFSEFRREIGRMLYESAS